MNKRPLTAYGKLTIWVGDALEVLETLETGSVNCVVTSPPYWRMRNYRARGQIGWEKTPELYAERLVEVFHEMRRVLRDDGVFWLNIADKYVKKELMGVPHTVRGALQADGWFWRNEIVWNKTNVTPQSAQDRITHAHEFLFVFTKGPHGYWWDKKAIEEPAEWARWGDQSVPKYEGTKTSTGWMKPKTKAELSAKTTRNKRSVWDIPTANYKGAHDAVFPPRLVEPCILASCPKGGLVLDPFIGSGTTGDVALSLGRRCVGIELKRESARQAVRRVRTARRS